jgi:hypothetical protein
MVEIPIFSCLDLTPGKFPRGEYQSMLFWGNCENGTRNMIF